MIMKPCKTVTGKLFYYTGSLIDGLTVRTSDEHGNMKKTTIRISAETIKIIKEAIKSHVEIAMGACRDNPSHDSIGCILLHAYKGNPNHCCYIIPLLKEAGFCTTRQDGRAFIVSLPTSFNLP